MKRKDLEVGERYYTNHRKGTKERIFIDQTETVVPSCGSRVLALEPYEEQFIYNGIGKTRGHEFVKVSKGNGVLVEQTYFWQGEKRIRTTIVNLSTIICPLEEAVKQITENRKAYDARQVLRAKEIAARDKYDREVLTPCFYAFTTALTNLHERVNGTPKRYDRDTRLGSMSLDVIETLTAIINEALVEKVGA
jgi:hypothetical protein